MNLIGQIIVPGVGGKGDVLKKPDCLAQCAELGRNLARGLTA